MLTTKQIEHAKPKPKIYRLFDGLGLYLEVDPNGGRYWRFKYAHLGKERRMALGKYPEISLLEAREQRDEARKLVAAGHDPASARQARRRLAIENAATTFEVVAREWHAHFKERWSPRYAIDTMHRLEKDIFPKMGKSPIADILAPEFLDVLRVIEKRGAHEVARRMLQVCGQIFRFAIVTGKMRYNPATDMRGAMKPVKREHFASIECHEIPGFLADLERNDTRLFVQTRLAIKFMMLTFVRTNELIGAKWSELDIQNKQWIIPAERMKMKRLHVVPLSRQSLEIIQEMRQLNGHREWIFASHSKPRLHMSNGTILTALKRLGYKGRMTGHGFRALAMSTIKEKLGYRHEVVDRQLAHAPANKVDAAYDRAKFLDERAKMMQEWSDYLDNLEKPNKVVQLDFMEAAE